MSVTTRNRVPTLRLLFLGDPSYDRRVQSFARGFVKDGWSVEIVCGVPKGWTARENMGLEGIRVVPIFLSFKSGPRYFIQYHRKLRSKLKQSASCDLLIASDLYSLGAAAFAMSRGLARLLVYDSREVYTELPTTANRPIVKWLWRRFERRGMSRADAILVTAPHDIEAIFKTHHFTPRSFLVRNLPERLERLDPDLSLRDRFGIPGNAPLFLYVGGLHKGRGLEPFVRAFKSVGSDSRFLIVGGGIERASLEALVSEHELQDRVLFAGRVPSEKILSLMAAADVGVTLIEPISLSYEYALPSKLFEYMMAGLVTLTSPLVHVRELFAHEPWLLTADPNSESAIVEAAKKAIEAARLPAVRARARSLALERYNFDSEIGTFKSFAEEHLREDAGHSE